MDSNRPPDVVVVAGGAPIAADLVASVPPTARVIAADSGVESCLALGWTVDLAIGDFDSLAPDLVDRLDQLATEVRRYDADKDATDLELALEAAAESGRVHVLVAGLEGGRPDHALANLLVAAADRFAAIDVELVLELGRAWVVHDHLQGSWSAGSTLSIVPVHGPATVSVAGVRWPLDHADLPAGTTRGVSNQALGGPVTLTVHAGTALCIAPRPPAHPTPTPAPTPPPAPPGAP